LPKIMTETLRLPSFQVQVPIAGGDSSALSSSATPSLRRKRFKMRRMKNVQSESSVTPAVSAAAATMRSEVMSKGQGSHSFSGGMEYLQLPSIEITPSSEEDAATTWSNCSTPSASPRRKRFLLHRWLNVREKKDHYSESSALKNNGYKCFIHTNAIAARVWSSVNLDDMHSTGMQ
uniref:Uncharacterized protein n=1 Tax=Oncorhynchus kisutch TaxID=8019 RepID=A0A8C7IHG2_ONCKI